MRFGYPSQKMMSPKLVFLFAAGEKTHPKVTEAFEDQDWEVLPQVFEAQISEKSTARRC